jgi:tRNA G10  N-methylase Trm11
MDKNIENIFVFVLGREQKIALAELESVLRRFCFDFAPSNISLVGNAAIINISNRSEEEVAGLINYLGGTTKIFKIVAVRDDKLPGQIARIIVDNLRSKKAIFAISNYARGKISVGLGASVKSKLRNRRISSRYISPKDGIALSSAESWHGIIKKKGVEAGLFQDTRYEKQKNQNYSNCSNYSNQIPNPNNQKNCHSELDSESKSNITIKQYDNEAIGVLIAVSNPDQWAKKDYGKPRSDAKSGMMPPKLARMLINIVCGQAITNNQDTSNLPEVATSLPAGMSSAKQMAAWQAGKQISNYNNQNENCKLRNENLNDVVVYDPFCGSGNILIEALDMGLAVAGGDISKKAAGDTKINLDWFLNLNKKGKIKENKHISKIKNNQCLSMDEIGGSALDVSVLDATKADFSKLFRASKASEAREAHEAVVVTEPYLGVPRKEKLSYEEAGSEVVKLKPLYLNFLANLYSQKKKINLVSAAIAFPLFELSDGGRTSLFSEVLDEIGEIGYIVPCEPFVYGREYQVVKREIVVLKVQGTRNNNQ